MAKQRTQPYGYQIEGGKVTISPQEAETIRRIYRQYAEGLSFKRIAEELTKSGARYMPEKPVWNKNMVARILQNKSYVGENMYPAIITATMQHSAELAQKPYTRTESQDIKLLKPLLVCAHCNEPIRRRIKTARGERWYCSTDVNHISLTLTDDILLQGIKALQRQFSEHPSQERPHSTTNKQIDITTIRLQNEIDLAISKPEPDLAEIQQNILTLTAQKYAATPDAYDDTAIEQSVKQLADSPLDSKLLKNITKHIEVKDSQVVAIILENGQRIQPYTAGKGVQNHV